MNWKAIVAGAVSGFVAAAVVDVNAWSKRDDKADPFDWWLAFKRWVAGAVSGAAGAAGFGALPF